jgi:hypothetical protein
LLNFIQVYVSEKVWEPWAKATAWTTKESWFNFQQRLQIFSYPNHLHQLQGFFPHR